MAGREPARVPFTFEQSRDSTFAMCCGRRPVVRGTIEKGARLAVHVDPGLTVDEVGEAEAFLDFLDGELIELGTRDPLLRYVARERGFTGAIRGVLRRDASTGGGRTDTSEGFDRTLEALLPGCTVTLLSSSAPAAAFRRASLGAHTVKLSVHDPVGPTDWAVAVQARPDVMVDEVASALDTAMAIKRRFAGHLPRLRSVNFVPLSAGYAGEAFASASAVSVNTLLVAAGDYEMSRARDIGRQQERPPAIVPAPWSQLDGVIAHELWHVIDNQFQARRFPASMEFRRRLGEYLGVATLEHVIGAARPDAPPARREGLRRLVAEVSPYAATNIIEATAEMFKLWWCRGDDPPPGAVALFGQLIEEFFPS